MVQLNGNSRVPRFYCPKRRWKEFKDPCPTLQGSRFIRMIALAFSVFPSAPHTPLNFNVHLGTVTRVERERETDRQTETEQLEWLVVLGGAGEYETSVCPR